MTSAEILTTAPAIGLCVVWCRITPADRGGGPCGLLLSGNLNRREGEERQSNHGLHSWLPIGRKTPKLVVCVPPAPGLNCPLGSEEGRHRLGDLARGADSRGHGVPRRQRLLQGHRKPSLQKRIVGQTNAIDAVARRLVLNKGPLKDGFVALTARCCSSADRRGKTELAKAVAEFLFGDDTDVRVDMSEYQDGSVSVDKLIGMPRGIVGSERGGVLTNQLQDNPYYGVLLDEVEKASPSTPNGFLQAFDEGWFTDGRGKRVDPSDAIIIMTSNLGAEHFRKLTSPLGFLSQTVGAAQVAGRGDARARRRFTPEFRNRIDEVVLFAPLTHDQVREIAKHYLETVKIKLTKGEKTLHVSDERSSWSSSEATAWPSARVS